MNCVFDSDSRDLLVLAVALAVALAQDQDQEQIGRMAAFFTLLGDTLALFALQPGLFRCCKALCQPEEEADAAPSCEDQSAQSPK